ncbi:hypothetical protein HT136_22635 [Novosphingobium profundi]|uniref:hypothetical protein n=1 Tax=Novosphingobium profundi TaxID=1774954 RepID=UPI001BDA52CD|nr:hypothetical protein [Novosphingobium profundi]MBT0671173.1 hypothetical protein [Novosphingobium profundi]
MTGGLTLLLRMRIWALLLLAAIGLQAAEPIRAPLERSEGSAWSSATKDLALLSNRRSEDASSEASPLPQPRLVRTSPLAPVEAVFALAREPHALPRAQAPPPHAHPARPPDATAPPRA